MESLSKRGALRRGWGHRRQDSTFVYEFALGSLAGCMAPSWASRFRARDARRLTALPHTRASCHTPLLLRDWS